MKMRPNDNRYLVFLLSNGQWVGQVTLNVDGRKERKTIYGKTKEEVKTKIISLKETFYGHNHNESNESNDNSKTKEDIISQEDNSCNDDPHVTDYEDNINRNEHQNEYKKSSGFIEVEYRHYHPIPTNEIVKYNN